MYKIPAVCAQSLPDQLGDDASVLLVRKSHFQPISLVNQLVMFEAEEAKHGGMVVVLVHNVFDGMVAPLVGLAMDVTASNPASRKPHRETVGVVISPSFVPALVVLNNRQSAHFTAPMHEGGVEK